MLNMLVPCRFSTIYLGSIARIDAMTEWESVALGRGSENILSQLIKLSRLRWLLLVPPPTE